MLLQSHNFFLLLSGCFLFTCIVLSYFLFRTKRINRDLSFKNIQLEGKCENLKNAKSLLEMRNSELTRAHNESDRFYGMLVQSADDGISFYDKSWNLRYANSAFYSMAGHNYESYHSIKPQDLVHPDDYDYQQRRIDSLRKSGTFESELRILHNNGQYIHLSTKSVTVKDDNGDVIGSLTVYRDITRLKQTHEDLLKANKDAEASSRLKSSFLANISHEIRTPLNSVVGFSNLLLSDDISRESREEYIEHINYNSEKLLQIISDIIDLSRLESSQIEIRYEETSVNSIIEEVARETKEVIRRNEKPVVLNVRNSFNDYDDHIFTDRVWLKRVLHHLLDNAVKFTLDGSIELKCSIESDKIIFKVKDTGIGINKENLLNIFEGFRQEVDGNQRPFDGLGVGLTLAREVVERMGGKIFVESEKGRGSEFGFSLPYRPAGGSRSRMQKLDDEIFFGIQDWSTRKCLIVDDNNDMLVYIRNILQETKINVISAHSGFEAIQLIKFTLDIDLVLLDMQMPGMNGIDVAREIRKTMPELTIIAQTAFIFEDDKDIILEAGCDACLIKPIRREQLIATMQRFLK